MSSIFDFHNPLGQLKLLGSGISSGVKALTLDPLSDTISSVLTGNVNYSNIGKDWDSAMATQNPSSWTYQGVMNGHTTQQIAQHTIDQYNSSNTAMSIGNTHAMAYSGNMNHIISPSQLMAISDPSTKVAYATAGSFGRRQMKKQGMMFDIENQSMFNNNVTHGEAINSAGGSGPLLDRDQDTRGDKVLDPTE